jgi:predicted nucleic acid-binding protein
MLAQNCRIYIDVLVLSEFINTYARLQWQIANKPHRDFKRFRKSPEFEPHAKAIADGAERVLRYCVRIENGFESLDIAALISDYAAGDSDFNDQVIASLCTERGLRLVTDDADFGGRGIPVLTANNRLLGGGHGPSS